jgi:putative SOS response-associated peptidase YedK
MCGRYGYSRKALNTIAAKMNLEIDGAIAFLLEQYRKPNHTPATPGPVVRSGKLEMMRWGFVGLPRPDGGAAPLHINARCETVHRLPAFRDSWAHRRCLVVADWFYEWDQRTKPKQPWRFVQTSEEPMVMAAFWKPTTLSDGQPVDAYAVITTAANCTVAAVHDRMPVLLHQKDWETWLDPATPPAKLKELQKPFDGEMFARPVDIRLNKASYQGEVGDITLPAEPPQQQQLSL